MFSMLLGTEASWNLELRSRGKRKKEEYAEKRNVLISGGNRYIM